MSNYGNAEQQAAYLEALGVEKAGYQDKIKVCEVTGDDAGVARYENRIKQVDAEIANVTGAEPSESDEASLEDRIAKANSAQLDAIAAEVGCEFGDDVTKVADKKAALLEHVAQ